MLSITESTELLPCGQLATRQWLLAQGFKVYQIDNALKSNKLKSLARGVVARPSVPVEWQGVLASLYVCLNTLSISIVAVLCLDASQHILSFLAHIFLRV